MGDKEERRPWWALLILLLYDMKMVKLMELKLWKRI
jgi:hypothetical protein